MCNNIAEVTKLASLFIATTVIYGRKKVFSTLPQDSSIFHCLAENKFGKSQRIIALVVQVRNTIVILLGKVTLDH